jgi:hypothetical protein
MSIDQNFESLKDSLVQFILEKFGFNEAPEIQLKEDHENSKEILGFTGHYDPDSSIITVFTTDRHPKDVLRSLAHEMIHHVQKLEGEFEYHSESDTSDPNYIMHDNFLKMIEADAFERGNIAFREWEAYQKGYNGEKDTNENKTWTDALSKAGEISYKAGNRGEKKWKIENKIAQVMTKGKKTSVKEEVGPHMDNENKKVEEVVVNDALKNSLSYIPEERPCAEAYATREEKVYNELLKKFKIKK